MERLNYCKNCVMDDSDPTIQIDHSGYCNYCNDFKSKFGIVNDGGPFYDFSLLEKNVEAIKRRQFKKEFDVIVGLSGGVDSSYTALMTHKLGLRALYVHFDSGWNTAVSAINIKRTLDYLSGGLKTHVMDWSTMKSLQRSFFLNGEINCDIPQDHAFLAILISYSKQYDIPYVVSGHNLATEYVMPVSWGYTSHDYQYIRKIQRKFEGSSLETFPSYNPYRYLLAQKFQFGIKFVRPLNYISYNKDKIQQEMHNTIGWLPYEKKHGESKFTSFFQDYYLFEKFGIDKRKAHFSSAILSGLMERDEAIRKLKEKPYDPDKIEFQLSFFAEKLDFTPHDFKKLIKRSINKNANQRSFTLSLLRTSMHRGLIYAMRQAFNGTVRLEFDRR